ncbi:hypothetical protein DSO57_1009548 [Entomophthora muscae]|uniref:Uncharacterized protein n=1 Tax=Entomophthora muscae TaxID=34485 RepID=A0ACC2S8R0_9FUNG|nr:hypothetical protein DSO57_1009548 [Entomophthora muscae]
MIIRQVKNLTQTGTVKELTQAYKELQLCAPLDMALDTPATHLIHYDTLKSHLMRHVNLDQATNLQSLYCKAEKAEQMSNTLHKAQTRKREQHKDSHPTGRSNQLPGNNSNNLNHKPEGSNGHGNGNNSQSNCTHFCITSTQDNQAKGKAQGESNSTHVDNNNVNSGHVDTFNANTIVK